MKLYYGIYYTGLELVDSSGGTIVEDHWFDIDSSNDKWTEEQQIPSGQHIIGLKCDTLGYEQGINQLSFLLGEVGQPGIVGELRFPPM